MAGTDESQTPDELREGVREGILTSLRRDLDLRGSRTARLLLLAGVGGVTGSLGATALLAGHPFGHHAPWHVAAFSAVWAGLLVVLRSRYDDRLWGGGGISVSRHDSRCPHPTLSPGSDGVRATPPRRRSPIGGHLVDGVRELAARYGDRRSRRSHGRVPTSQHALQIGPASSKEPRAWLLPRGRLNAFPSGFAVTATALAP